MMETASREPIVLTIATPRTMWQFLSLVGPSRTRKGLIFGPTFAATAKFDLAPSVLMVANSVFAVGEKKVLVKKVGRKGFFVCPN